MDFGYLNEPIPWTSSRKVRSMTHNSWKIHWFKSITSNTFSSIDSNDLFSFFFPQLSFMSTLTFAIPLFWARINHLLFALFYKKTNSFPSFLPFLLYILFHSFFFLLLQVFWYSIHCLWYHSSNDYWCPADGIVLDWILSHLLRDQTCPGITTEQFVEFCCSFVWWQTVQYKNHGLWWQNFSLLHCRWRLPQVS